MSVKTIDIFGPKASAKVDPKLLEQKQQGKTEGFDQLLQEIVQQDEKTQKIALPKAKMSKQLQRPLPPKLDNQERDVKENGDKAFFLEDIPKGREVVKLIQTIPTKNKEQSIKKEPDHVPLKVDDVLVPQKKEQKINSRLNEKQVTQEANIERKPFFFSNQKIEDFESKFSEKNLKQSKVADRNSFFPKPEVSETVDGAVNKLDTSFEREALVNKENVLPFRKALTKQTYFPEIKSDKKIYSEENSKIEPFNKFQQRDDVFFGPNTDLSISKPEVLVKQPLELSQMQGTKAEVIEQISDYILRNSFGNQRSLTVTVSHKDLGQFQVEAHRHGEPGDIKLNILTNTEEGRLFFKVNQQELVQKLSDKGISVFDFKVANFSNSANQAQKSDSGFNFQQNHSNNAYSEESQNPQYNEGQERRRELWEKYKEQLGA